MIGSEIEGESITIDDFLLRLADIYLVIRV